MTVAVVSFRSYFMYGNRLHKKVRDGNEEIKKTVSRILVL